MSSEEQDSGERWIVERVEKFAVEECVQIEQLNWYDDPKDGARILAIVVRGRRATERFMLAELEDLSQDGGIQAVVEHRLTLLLRVVQP